MRRLLAGVAVLLAVTGCRAVTTPDSGEQARLAISEPLPLPNTDALHDYTAVSAGSVQAVIPHQWDSTAVEGESLHVGIMASPRLEAFKRLDGSVQGIAATWLDSAEAGIPFDYYYLAASGGVLRTLTEREGCHRDYHLVIVDHRPDSAGAASSPADYVARAGGTCLTPVGVTRWAYVVAAPGYGPVREMGIPSSGLYMVLAVVLDSPDTQRELRQLLLRARFGDAPVSDLLAAARQSRAQI
jgi:hypothetical protein